jgi:hypothetical protein
MKEETNSLYAGDVGMPFSRTITDATVMSTWRRRNGDMPTGCLGLNLKKGAM